jgi:hypothetical protein
MRQRTDGCNSSPTRNTHQEQHQYDTIFCKVHDVLTFFPYQSQYVGSNQQTGQQVAKGRAQPEAPGYGHGDNGRGEINKSLYENFVCH